MIVSKEHTVKVRRVVGGAYYMGTFVPFDIQQLQQRLRNGKIPYNFKERIRYLKIAFEYYWFSGQKDYAHKVKVLIEKEIEMLRFKNEIDGVLEENALCDNRLSCPDDAQSTSAEHPPPRSESPPEPIPFAGVFVANSALTKDDMISILFENLVKYSLIDTSRTSLQDFKMVFGYRQLSQNNPRPIVWLGEVNGLAYFIKQMISRNYILDSVNKWRIVECNFVIAKNGSHPSCRALRQARQPRECVVKDFERIFPQLPGLLKVAPVR